MDKLHLAKLATSPLFQGVDPRGLSDALDALPHHLRSYEAGNVLLLAGCAYGELIVLLEGEVGAEMANDEGKSVLVETIRAPEAVATAILFSPERILPVSVVARTAVLCVALPRDSVLGLCARFKPLLEALLGDMGGRLAALAEKLRALQFATLRERLADWMLRRLALSPPPSPGAPPSIRLEASKERLSSLFGVARPSLSRELGELQRRGLIRVEGRLIEILDAEGLRRLKAR